MKTLKHNLTALFAFSVFLFYLPPIAVAQYYPPDSCLKLPQGTVEYPISNPDSVLIDSCWDSPTFREMYTKKYFIVFNRWVYIFTPKPFQRDSLYTWRDIDSNHEEMKNVFQELEIKYGPYYFKRYYSDDSDSGFIKVPTCLIVLDNYVCADTLINFIKTNFLSDSIFYIDMNSTPTELSVLENNNANDFSVSIDNNNKMIKILSRYNGQGGINICIYDVMGRVIKRQIYNSSCDFIQINISDIEQGIYFIVINNRYVYKLLKD
jgi:hypothetical protein